MALSISSIYSSDKHIFWAFFVWGWHKPWIYERIQTTQRKPKKTSNKKARESIWWLKIRGRRRHGQNKWRSMFLWVRGWCWRLHKIVFYVEATCQKPEKMKYCSTQENQNRFSRLHPCMRGSSQRLEAQVGSRSFRALSLLCVLHYKSAEQCWRL